MLFLLSGPTLDTRFMSMAASCLLALQRYCKIRKIILVCIVEPSPALSLSRTRTRNCMHASRSFLLQPHIDHSFANSVTLKETLITDTHFHDKEKGKTKGEHQLVYTHYVSSFLVIHSFTFLSSFLRNKLDHSLIHLLFMHACNALPFFQFAFRES